MHLHQHRFVKCIYKITRFQSTRGGDRRYHPDKEARRVLPAPRTGFGENPAIANAANSDRETASRTLQIQGPDHQLQKTMKQA
jgi:hypothetical protein